VFDLWQISVGERDVYVKENGENSMYFFDFDVWGSWWFWSGI
jgi:hypothetical protein